MHMVDRANPDYAVITTVLPLLSTFLPLLITIMLLDTIIHEITHNRSNHLRIQLIIASTDEGCRLSAGDSFRYMYQIKYQNLKMYNGSGLLRAENCVLLSFLIFSLSSHTRIFSCPTHQKKDRTPCPVLTAKRIQEKATSCLK